MKTLLIAVLLTMIVGLLFVIDPAEQENSVRDNNAKVAEPKENLLVTETIQETVQETTQPIDETAEKGREIALIDLSELAVGDTLELYIPYEDAEYSGDIEKIEISRAGSKSLIGFFDIAGEQYRFIFTIGREFTFGTVHTPKGRYQLESRDGIGRIVSVNEINTDRDFSKPDYVMPDSLGDSS